MYKKLLIYNIIFYILITIFYFSFSYKYTQLIAHIFLALSIVVNFLVNKYIIRKKVDK